MTTTNQITPRKQTLIEDYKLLSVQERVTIMAQIVRLEGMRIDSKEKGLSAEIIEQLLAKTGHQEIATACYTAQLLRINWRS
jgi:hypothetical protein